MKTLVLHYNASLTEAIYDPACDGPDLDDEALDAAKLFADRMFTWATENFPDYNVEMSNDWGVIGSNAHCMVENGVPQWLDGYEDPELFRGLELEEDRLLTEIAMSFATDADALEKGAGE